MAPKKIERKANPDFMGDSYDVNTLFSELIQVGELPSDWTVDGHPNREKYITGRMFYSDRPKGKQTIVQRIDRTDEKELERVIRIDLQNFLDQHKYNTPKLFRDQKIELIRGYIETHCPNWNKPRQYQQLELYNDLTRYRAVLLKIVPDEVTTETKLTDRHPKDHPFTTPEAYEVFKFLADEYHDERFVKWSVIFEFMKNMRIETHLSGRKYLQWIKENYQPKMKSENVQTGTDEAHEIITKVFSRYKKPT